jgi:uncharacterized membrane protein (Fun14 family)
MGWALKKAIKLFAMIERLFLAGLAYLQYQQIASINWNKLEAGITTLRNVTTSTINDNSSVAALGCIKKTKEFFINALNFHIPNPKALEQTEGEYIHQTNLVKEALWKGKVKRNNVIITLANKQI